MISGSREDMNKKKSGMQLHESVGGYYFKRNGQGTLKAPSEVTYLFYCYVMPMLPVSWDLGEYLVFWHVNISAVECVIFILSRVKKDELLHISAYCLSGKGRNVRLCCQMRCQHTCDFQNLLNFGLLQSGLVDLYYICEDRGGWGSRKGNL